MSWALHNSLKGWTLYDLSDREIQLLVRTMSSNELKLTKVCNKNSKRWNMLDQSTFPQFFLNSAEVGSEYPALEDARNDSNVDTEYFVVRPQKVMFPRLHKRYEHKANCFVFSTTRQFQSETVDMSEGGLHFRDIIPDWVAGYFIVGVHGPEMIIHLMCSIVEDQKERKRVQIVSEESDPQFLLYKSWLNSLVAVSE